jgi:DNA-binding winged helix-turn-helix (wHTH) protein
MAVRCFRPSEVRLTSTQTLSAAPAVRDSRQVYQGSVRPPPAPAETTQVVLVIDVPSGIPQLISRAEELVNEFGWTVTRSVPGLRARRAVVVAAGAALEPRAPYPRDLLTIDLANRDVWIDGEVVHLTYREFELLCHLAVRPGRVVSRGDLMRDVWREESVGGSDVSWRTVDTHVRRLRVKLGRYQRVLTTVRGQGYRFERRSDVHFVGTVERMRPA